MLFLKEEIDKNKNKFPDYMIIFLFGNIGIDNLNHTHNAKAFYFTQTSLHQKFNNS